MLNNKLEKIITKIIIIFLIVIGISVLTTEKKSSAATYYTVTTGDKWKEVCEDVSSVSNGLYYITMGSNVTCDSSQSMTISSSQYIYIYGEGYSIKGYNSNDYNAIFMDGGYLAIYDLTLYSNYDPVIVNEANGSQLLMYEGSRIYNNRGNSSEGSIDDGGYSLRIYLYNGTIANGFQSTTSLSTLKIAFDGLYSSGDLTSDYQECYIYYQISYRTSSSSTITKLQTWILPNATATLQGSYFTENGYTQVSWKVIKRASISNSSTSSAVSYSLGGSITMNYPAMVYPVYSLNSYDITYNLNGGDENEDNPDTYDVEDDDITLEETTRNGYTFAGWYEDSSLSGSAVTTIDVDDAEDKEFYAKWSLNTYTITYVNDGDTNTNETEYNVENDDITLVDPTRTGYTFEGWYTTSTFDDEAVTTIDVDNAEDKTFYAKWYIDDYSISYELYGGTNSAFNPDSYSCDDSDISLSNPTRTGYTFIGWYTDEDFSGNEVTTISVSTLADLLLYAKWCVTDYTVSYDLNGGITEYSNPNSYTIEDSNIELTSLSKTGYTFVGWYASSDFSGDLVTEIDTSECSNIILYAKFEINSYTISFNTNGGTSVDTITADYLEDISSLEPTSVKTGYTFKGWYTDSDLTDEYTFDTMGFFDIVLYASWSPDCYTITFDSNGGSTVHSIFADYLEDISSLEQTPTRTGYTFNGWYTDSDLTDEYTFDTMDCEDITLYADWIINSYTITFDSNEGSSVDSITSEYGSVVSKPTDPTLSGYAFAGWYTDTDLTESYTFSETVNENITLYAKWVVVYTSDDTTISGDVTDLSSILSESELLDLVSIKIVVNTNNNNIDDTDKSLIEDFITSMNNSNIDSYYLNITVYGISSDNTSYEVTELQSQTTITIAVDDDYTGYSNYGIIRCHDGETEELESTYDSDTNTITFSSNEFSTYSIYYFNSSDIATTDTATSSVFAYNVSYISAAIIFMFGILLILLFKIANNKSEYSSDRRLIISDSNSKEYYIEQIKKINNEIKNNLIFISLNVTGRNKKNILSQMKKYFRTKTYNLNIKKLLKFSNKKINDKIISFKSEINNNLKSIKQVILLNKDNKKNLSKKEISLIKKSLEALNNNKY